MTFDKWFAREGYDEQHRFVFGLAWNAGIDSASETNDRSEIAAQQIEAAAWGGNAAMQAVQIERLADDVDRKASCLVAAAIEIHKLREALRYMEGWDCKGDSLRDAYEQGNGANSWAALFVGPNVEANRHGTD